MDTTSAIVKFEEFFELMYKDKLHQIATKMESSIYVNFQDVSTFDVDLANFLLESPEEGIISAEHGLAKLDISMNDKVKLFVRFINLPKSQTLALNEIRDQIGKFVRVEGLISTIGDIYNRVTSIRYECPNCNHMISIVNHDRFKKKDSTGIKCPCGRKGTFREVSKATVRYRKVTIEEDIMELGERQEPRRKMCVLENDLVGTDVDSKTLAGKKVIMNGVLNFYEINEKNGDMDTYLLVNSIEFIEQGWDCIALSPSDMKSIKEMCSNPNLVRDLSQSILPDIEGEEEVKHALLIQLAGSDNVVDEKNYLLERGCIHMAFIGAPGVGKTYIVKKMSKFWPKYKFTSAVTASGRGLVAIVTQDKTLGKWVLMPGVIPMCNKGITVIDELEKMNEDEYGHLNNAMNDLKVTVVKAAQGVLETDVSILATMNPSGRIFTDSLPVHEQIDLPKDLIDRFDLIYPITARVDEQSQRKVLQINIDKRMNRKKVQPLYTEEQIVKFFAYCRQIHPVLPEKLHKPLSDRMMAFMSKPSSNSNFSNRVYNVVLRLIHATARLHAHNEITSDDINEAMDVLISSYKKQGLISVNGFLDYAKVEHIDMKVIDIRKAIIETLSDMGAKENNVMEQDLINSIKPTLSDKYNERDIEHEIEKLRMKGDIFAPRPGLLKLNPV